MAEQIPANIRLHPDSEGMAIIGHHIIQEGPEQIAAQCHSHDDEEGLVQLIRQHVVKGAAGDQREGQVNGRNTHGAAHIQGEELFVICEITQKNHQRTFPLKLLGGHKNASFS